MGTQFHLPPELMEVADQLRGLHMPESRLDRDQLFYEAGKAAAAGSSRSRSALPWQLASGALAAAVLVLSTLLMQSPDVEPLVVEAPVAAPPAETLIVDNRFVAAPRRMEIRQWPDSAPLLTLRDAALRMELPEPKLVASEGKEFGSLTVGELLQEMLPRNVAPGSAGG